MAIFTLAGAAIAGAIGLGSATLFGVSAGSLIAGGLALATSLALSYINRPKKPRSTAVQGQVQLGGDVDTTVLFGTGKTKGHRNYYAKYGGGNAVNAEVFVLADGRCDGLEPYVYFYGEKHDLISVATVGNEHARYTVDGFGSSIIIRFYDGRPGQLADSELVTATSGLANKWKSTSTMTNQAYVVVERTWSASLFDKGRPDFDFVLRGWCMYDPRKDSTVPGGSGSHRLDDPSTWEHSQNPAIHRLNFQLGFRGALSGDVLVGVGKPVNQIDLAMHMVAANVCDTERTVGERTIPTYHNNLFVSSEDDHIAVLQTMEDAMAGYAVNRAGLDGVLAGAPQVPVLEITNADIRVDAPRTAKNRRSGFDGINILSGQFTSIEAHWKPESLKTVSVNADITADGRKRLAGNDFLQVTDPDIAQYLLNIRYRQNRKAKKRSLPISRKVGCRIQPGDWVTYDGADWLVTQWGFDAKFQFTVELSETGDDIYDEEGIPAGPVVVPPSTPTNPSLISTVANFDVAAGLIEGDDGEQAPALQFTWDDPEDPTVTQVRIEYRKSGTTEPIYYAVSNDPASGSLIVGSQVVGGTIYEARATITTVPDRFKTYTSWATSATATAKRIVDSAKGLYDTATDTIRTDVLSDLRASAYADLLRITTEEDRRGRESDLWIRETDAARASIEETRVLIADEATARTAAFQDLQADLTDAVTGISGNATAISGLDTRVTSAEGAITAQATSITGLQASVGDVSAGGFYRLQAIVGPLPGDVSSEFAVALNAGTEGTPDWQTAGFALQILSGGLGSRAVFNVDQFVVTDGTTVTALFEEGQALFKSAIIPDLTTDKITGLEAYFDSLFATNISAASISTDQLTVGGTAITANLLEDDAVTPNRMSSETGLVSVAYSGSAITAASILSGSTPFNVLQTYAATDLNDGKPAHVWMFFEGVAEAENKNFSLYTMWKFPGDTNYNSLIGSTNFSNPNGLQDGVKYFACLGWIPTFVSELDFRVVAVQTSNQATFNLNKVQIVVSQAAK
ncbi:phage tail protein [Stappia sp.]|uniref:phage tail protein n=1 Tax=Stappia sp. TaxID=1870903 RepID=UPI003C7EBA25